MIVGLMVYCEGVRLDVEQLQCKVKCRQNIYKPCAKLAPNRSQLMDHRMPWLRHDHSAYLDHQRLV
eukprot:4632764-Amphidinium_carterae.1